ncbi:MAG: hypothetical protein NTU63_00110 [Candidatus Pacearchaeota archaeon]|nr:hypothetical protein [Candidatus Pacearchaeota archaeon]
MNKALLIGIITIFVVITIVFILINLIYISYYSEELAEPKIYCNGDILKKSGEDITNMSSETLVNLFCAEYLNSKYVIYCKDDIPIITCKTTIFRKYFTK